MRTLKMAVCVVTILILALTTCLGSSPYERGERDGRRDGSADASYTTMVLGYFLGVVNLAWTVFTGPAAYPLARLRALEDKSREYRRGYRSGYAWGKQGSRLFYAAVGLSMQLRGIFLH